MVMMMMMMMMVMMQYFPCSDPCTDLAKTKHPVPSEASDSGGSTDTGKMMTDSSLCSDQVGHGHDDNGDDDDDDGDANDDDDNDDDGQDTGDQAGDTVQWGESSESLGGAQLR